MDLEKLGKIQKVETPPFLFTKIQQKIELSKKEKMPKNISWALSISFALLLVINGFVFFNTNSKTNTTENYASAIHLTSNNSLYK